MAGSEASAIYEQFAHTPLKIRPQRRRDDVHASDAVGATGAEKGTNTTTQEKSQLPDVSSVAVKLSFASPSGPSPPLSPTHKKACKVQGPEHASAPVSKQRSASSGAAVDSEGGLVKAKRTRAHEASATAAVGTSKVDAVREGSVRSLRKRKARSDSTTSEHNMETEPVTELVVSDQKPQNKRISRSVLPKTSGITITIPTKKAAHFVKRRRTIVTKAKSTADPTTISKAPNSTDSMDLSSVANSAAPEEVTPTKGSRSLLASFARCIGDDEKELSTPQKIPMSSKKGLVRKTRKLATPKSARRSLRIQLSLPDAKIPVDYITVACDELLETNTISGALFSVGMNSLRDLQEGFLEAQVGRMSSDPVPNPFQPVCSLCKGIAACEKRAESHNKSSVKSTLLIRRRGSKSTTTEKSVRFQSFDLSCLNLHYVKDAHTEALVDKIIFSYDEIMNSIAPMLQQASTETSAPDTFESRIFQEMVRALNDKSMLYINPDTLATEAERIYLAAFGSRDPHTQHEIEVSRSYYAREFKKLVTSDESAPRGANFLQDMFSSLMSSSMRFKLRALFLEYESDASERGQPSVNMATYAHQDFGSAVHCALQESLLYEPLATPVIALLDEKSQLMEHLDNTAMDDFEHIEQYVLARRFLGYHVKKAYEAPSSDGFASTTWAKIERLCGIAKRYNFEDEAHFFPLASVKDFIAELEAQEPAFLQLESSVGDFYDQKKAQSTKESQHPCLECGETVTRQEAAGFIVCTMCAGSFHLNCLHLPPSFAQFARQYTCPSCFLGRRR